MAKRQEIACVCQLSNDCWPETMRTIQLLKLVHSGKDGEHRSPQKKSPSQVPEDDPQLVACASTSPKSTVEAHGEFPKPEVGELNDLALTSKAMAKKLKVRALENSWQMKPMLSATRRTLSLFAVASFCESAKQA